MKPLLVSHRPVRLLLLGALLPAVALAAGAEISRDSAAKSSSTRSSTASRGGPAGKVLPDPTLLDGSNQPAEKKSDYGMIGDFELPGDENAPRDGKVGGGAGGKGGTSETGQGGPGMKVSVPGLPMPGQSGGGGEAAGQKEPSAGDQAGGAGNGPNGQESGANPAGAAGQQGGQPGGIQVGQLGGEGAPGQGPDGLGERPRPVVIGDAAMRIPNSTPAASATVGQVPASANTQNYEKGTGSGGKASSAAGGPNRAEKGRPIPAGL